MGLVARQEGGGILGGAQVDVTLVRPYQVGVGVVRFEGKSPPTVHQFVCKCLLADVDQGFAEVEEILVCISDGRLDKCPVGHSAISGYRVEIQIIVQIIRTPFNLFEIE